jgi:hypothetical protein
MLVFIKDFTAPGTFSTIRRHIVPCISDFTTCGTFATVPGMKTNFTFE